MAAEDHLGPQWDAIQTHFDPEHASYSGSEYQYVKVNPQTGEQNRNSRNVANMLAGHYAADVKTGVPTGATTDFRAPEPSQHPSMQGKPHLWGFQPNAHDQMHRGPGAWN